MVVQPGSPYYGTSITLQPYNSLLNTVTTVILIGQGKSERNEFWGLSTRVKISQNLALGGLSQLVLSLLAQLTNLDSGSYIDISTNLACCCRCFGLLPGTPPAQFAAGVTNTNIARGINPPLNWSLILQEVAQAKASQCDFKKNAQARQNAIAVLNNIAQPVVNTANPDPVFAAAEAYDLTLATNTGAYYSQAKAENAPNDWLAEAANYDCTTNTCAPGAECGHFIAMSGVKPEFVGCAAQQCTTNSPLPFATTWWFYVCVYNRRAGLPTDIITSSCASLLK